MIRDARKHAAGVVVAVLAAIWASACDEPVAGPVALAPSVAVTPPPATLPTPSPTPSAAPSPASDPTPEPTPALCPPLSSWNSRIFNITDFANERVAEPAIGGHVVIDSTPLFSGRECNAEHDNCGGRHCEDPRGGLWLIDGNSRYEIRQDGYQVRIGPLNGGTHSWQVCPRADAEDAEGEPLTVRPDACSQGSFFVPYN